MLILLEEICKGVSVVSAVVKPRRSKELEIRCGLLSSEEKTRIEKFYAKYANVF